MAREGLTGSRIRERRGIAGLKQAELANMVGISASYLNLIEHNRRRIGGKLLLNIAATLGVDPYAVGVNPQEEFMKRIHPDDVSIMLDADRQCIEGKTPHSKSEFRIAVSKGEWRWLRSNAAVAARDSSGRATRFVGVQADVTALRFANDALKSSREQF